MSRSHGALNHSHPVSLLQLLQLTMMSGLKRRFQAWLVQTACHKRSWYEPHVVRPSPTRTAHGCSGAPRSCAFPSAASRKTDPRSARTISPFFSASSKGRPSWPRRSPAASAVPHTTQLEPWAKMATEPLKNLSLNPTRFWSWFKWDNRVIFCFQYERNKVAFCLGEGSFWVQQGLPI